LILLHIVKNSWIVEHARGSSTNYRRSRLDLIRNCLGNGRRYSARQPDMGISEGSSFTVSYNNIVVLSLDSAET
jgi:hypothetical protein